MEDAKSAVGTATAFLENIVTGTTGTRVEEVEGSEGNWFVTISYLAPPDGPLAAMQVMSPLRVYKRFHIVGGEVRSMKIRETEDA